VGPPARDRCVAKPAGGRGPLDGAIGDGAEAKERIHATTASAWESQGKIDLALAEYEKALTNNPLNLQLQQRYWTLKQRGAKPTPPPESKGGGPDVPGQRRRPPGRS